jgi:hypothetical protein
MGSGKQSACRGTDESSVIYIRDTENAATNPTPRICGTFTAHGPGGVICVANADDLLLTAGADHTLKVF